MKKKTVSGLLLTLLFLCTLTLALDIQPVRADTQTWTVDDDGPADFARIQDAIDAANAGDTILVLEGYYAEGRINVTKPLTLLGNGEVVVDGLQKGWWTIRVTSSADEVTIKGLTVINGGHGIGLYLEHARYCVIEENVFTQNAGISISGYGNRLRKNLVTDGAVGINLAMAGSNVIEQNVVCDNRDFGLYLWLSDGNSIWENILKNNEGPAIYLDNSYTNDISENIIEGNSGGVYAIWDSMYNTIVRNKIRNNEYAGIAFVGHHTVVKENEITGNKDGILMMLSSQNIVEENRIFRNDRWGIGVTHYSDANTIRENLALHQGEHDLYWDGSGEDNIWTENKYKTKNW